jgi:hypothetical protein
MLLTTAELARAWGVSPGRIRQHRMEGRLDPPGRKLGRDWWHAADTRLLPDPNRTPRPTKPA